MKKTDPSFSPSPRIVTLLSATLLAFGLAACDKADDRTVGQQIDSAVAKSGQVASDAQRKMEAAANEAGDATRQAAERAAAVMDDAGITAKVSAGLAQDAELSAVRIDVDTRNGIVTLNGPVKSKQASERATHIAQGVQGVNSVVNQLTVSSAG